MGLSYWIGKSIFHNPDRPFLSQAELDALPFPDLGLIKGYEVKEVVPVQTSRGCPFNCTFCSVTPMFGKGYRFRSVGRIMDELERLKKMYPKAKLFFYDDNFAASLPRAKALLRAMIHQRVMPTWQTQVRAEAARDIELMELMSFSGCKWLFLGLESVNPETLNEYKKGQTVADIAQGIKTIHSFGMKALGMFVIGSDSDIATTAKKTVRFANKHKIDAIQLWALGPLPGTLVYENLKAKGRLLFEELGIKKWRLYDGVRVVIQPENMTALQLQLSIGKAMAGYYAWKWFGKSLMTAVKFVSFRSWKDIRSQAESLALSVYARRLTKEVKKFLKEHLDNLKKIKAEKFKD